MPFRSSPANLFVSMEPKNGLTIKTNTEIMISRTFTRQIIKNAMDVHTALGPGLLESAYKECLYYNLSKNGFHVQKEKAMPLFFKEVQLDCGYRVDLLVENKLVLELKSVTQLNDIHLAQTLTYLNLGNFELGLLINFNVVHLRDGIKRVINSKNEVG